MMAAKLGVATVSFVGCIGDDGQGRMMRDAMDAVGINSTELVTATDGKATGVATILIGEVSCPAARATVARWSVRRIWAGVRSLAARRGLGCARTLLRPSRCCFGRSGAARPDLTPDGWLVTHTDHASCTTF